MSSGWPQDPDGDMVPVLEQSIEAAKARHPSGAELPPAPSIVLNALDRCDSCGGPAVYRVGFRMDTPELQQPTLDFCGHHWRKSFPAMVDVGWQVTGTNPELVSDGTS